MQSQTEKKYYISQEGVASFQETLLKEFDDALVGYLLLHKNPEIREQLQRKQLTLLFTKIYIYNYLAVIIGLSLIFYRNSSERLPFLSWIRGFIAYTGLNYGTSYCAQLIFPHDNNKEKITSVAMLFFTSCITLLVTRYKHESMFIILQLALDHLLIRQITAFVTDRVAFTSGNQSSEWLSQHTLTHSNQIIHAGTKLLQEQNIEEEQSQLKLPQMYLGEANTKAKSCRNVEEQTLLSLEDILVNALNTLPWKDQLSLRLTLKLFINETIAAEFAKKIIVEFHQQLNETLDSNDIESQKDYLYSIVSLYHSLLPTRFSYNGVDYLSNALDDSATFRQLQKKSNDTLHIKYGFRVNSLESRVADKEFLALHKVLSRCASKFFVAHDEATTNHLSHQKNM